MTCSSRPAPSTSRTADAGHDRDGGLPGDAVDQVLRHARGQIFTADDDRHRVPMIGQPRGRLAGRVAPAHDGHRRHRGDLVLGGQRRVEDARALETVQASRVERAVGHAGGDHDRSGGELVPVVEPNDVVITTCRQSDCCVGHQQCHPEPQRLHQRPFGELLAADAHREAEVVLDPRRGADLAADPDAVEHGGGQTFRRAVHRGGQAGRAGADHRHIEGPPRHSTRAEPRGACQLRDRRIAQDLTAAHQHDRGITRAQSLLREQPRPPRGRRPRRPRREAAGCGPRTLAAAGRRLTSLSQ